MEKGKLIKRIIEYWLKTGYARFLSSLVVLGVTLLGLSWVDLAALLTGRVTSEGKSKEYASLAQLVGIVLIVIGLVGRTALHLYEKSSEAKAIKKSENKKEKERAANLIGRIKVLIHGFEDDSVSRDAGYYNVEIDECRKAADEFKELAPSKFSSDRVVCGISNPKFDAAKLSPYIDINLDELRNLVKQLGEHYEIE